MGKELWNGRQGSSRSFLSPITHDPSPGQPRRAERGVGAGRDVDVALDVVLYGFELVGYEEADPGEILQQQRLDLLIDTRSLLLVGNGDALVNQLVHLRVRVVDEVTALSRLEVLEDEGVRVDVGALTSYGNIVGLLEVDLIGHCRVLD